MTQCRRQPMHGRSATSASSRPSRPSLSRLARNSAAERSPKAERDRFSTCKSGVVSSLKNRSKSPWFNAIMPLGRRGTCFGECRTFSGVIASIEFAIGALEVVLVEAAVVDDPSVVADLGHDEGSSVSYPGVVGLASLSQMQAVTPHRQRASSRNACTARAIRSTAVRTSSARLRVTAPPIVVHERS